MKVSPATTIPAGIRYKFHTLTFTSNENCKAFYIPKEKYGKSKAVIQEKKIKGVIKSYLLIPFHNYDGCIALINY